MNLYRSGTRRVPLIMYCPEHFAETNPNVLRNFIERHNFGTLVSSVDGRPFATHLPFLFDAEGQRLLAHMARANPHWQALAAHGSDALVIFQGPHSYISPSWYAGPGVPTWNYTAVHVYGGFNVLADPVAHRGALELLTAKHEAGQASPWQADFATPFIDRMNSATVAFEIVVKEIQGKFKLSQNRSQSDRDNVIRKLRESGHDDDENVARLMQDRQ